MLALGQLGVDFYRSLPPTSVPVHEFAYYDVRLSALSQSDLPKASAGNDQPATNNQQPATPYCFLYVGQLIRRKGVDRLLRSLAAVPSREWTLEVVGEGSEKAALQQLGSSLGISEKLHWHSRVPSAELHAYYQRADCLVLPSRWDGWGMTVNEALRYGCAVLVSQTCGAASAAPETAQLPRNTKLWANSLAAKIDGGVLGASARAANQQSVKSLSGKAGVERLKTILSAN